MGLVRIFPVSLSKGILAQDSGMRSKVHGEKHYVYLKLAGNIPLVINL